MTTVLNTSTLFTIVPLGTALVSFVILKEKIGTQKTIVYIIGAIGTIWVIFQGNINLLLSFSLNKGDLLFLLGALSMCCYAVSMKFLYKNDEMIVFVFSILLGGMFWSYLVLLGKAESLQWNLITESTAYNMLYLAIPATLVTTYLSQKATVILGPNKVISYFYLNPILVAILLYIINDITIEMIIIPGVLISILATILLQRKQKEKLSI